LFETPCIIIYAADILTRDVNKTLKLKTETRWRLLAFSPRQDRDWSHPSFPWDRDLCFWIWDETETKTFTDRDVFWDLTYTVFRKKHPLLFSYTTLRKSNQSEWKFQTK